MKYINRTRQSPDRKKWTLLSAALVLVLVGLTVLFFSHHPHPPEIAKEVDNPARPKLLRPVRLNAGRSERTKEINKNTETNAETAGTKSSACRKTMFDKSTRILRWEIDSTCDGSVDYCLDQYLNQYGEDVRSKAYEGCGNKPSFCIEMDRNEYGEVIEECIDADCDGRFEGCRTFKYNDHGDVVETIVDDQNDGKLDGKLDEHKCFSYAYDAKDRIVREDEGKCGEEPTNCKDYEYDPSARIRREKWDDKCDGAVDLCLTKVYRGDSDISDDFIDARCHGTWTKCFVHGERDGQDISQTFMGNDACAEKYEELVKKNLGKR